MGIVFHDRFDPALRELANAWSGTVLTFARTGDPNGAGLPQWDRYTTDERACLILDTTARIELDPDGDHRELWK